jgi:hypothetical protein
VGNAVYVEQDSDATVTNTIAWGNGGDDFYVAEDSSLTVTYTLSQEVWAGTGNFTADPRFANAAAGDFHVRSTAGRFDPAANGGAGGFVLDATDSPAINAANPAAAFNLEPQPNGGRANLGVYGNTAEASMGGEVGEGNPDGEGVAEGEGVSEGEGVTEGEGTPDGEGVAEGEGVVEGEGIAEGEGEPEGENPYVEEYRQLLFTFGSAETSDDNICTLDEIRSQRADFPEAALLAADANNDNQLSVAELLQATGGGIVMSADTSGDFIITLSELLRIIQLYNAGQYACAANAGSTEDGFLPRAQQGGDPACVLHSTDNNDSRVISLSELLRSIQFYSLGGYSYCPGQGTEDDFCL